MPPATYAWLVVFLLCVVGCLNYLDRIMITTMRTSIVEGIPMTDAQFGLLTSVFLWVYGLLSPFAGFLADKFKRSRVIIASLFLWSIVTWLTAHAQTYEQLLATRVLMGLSEAAYLPAALALITDFHRGSTRSLAVGIHIGGVMVGQSLGFLGGWIAETSHWSNAFTIFGTIGTVYSLVLMLFLRDAERPLPTAATASAMPIQTNAFGTAMKELFSKPSFLLLIVFWCLLGIIGWMVIGWLPTYYKEKYNLSQAVAGLYATGYLYPVSLAGSLVGGYLADQWTKRHAYGRLLLPVVGLAVAAPAILLGASTAVSTIALVGFMVYAFTRIFSDVNITPILCMITNNRFIATGYGVLNMLACIVGGIGIYVSGHLRDRQINIEILFQSASVLLIVCIGLLLIIIRMLKTTNHKSPTV